MDQTQRLVEPKEPGGNGAAILWEKGNPEALKYGATEEPKGKKKEKKVVETNSKQKCTAFMKKLIRRKVFTEDSMAKTDLHRCLSTIDLINLGIGSCICNGIYIIVGEVAKDVAGPGVLLSFLVAGMASAFAAICYAEFAARVPRAGSAYVYSYVTVGEFMAFVIGWNLLLEYIIGTASSARALSMYFNSMINNTIKDCFREYMPMDVTGFSSYPDFFSLALTLVITVLLAVGVRESTHFNNVFTFVNFVVIIYIVICGLFKADIHNWQLPESEIPKNGAGTGGFLPFGMTGVMSGAATCFYAYVGFDCIATTGEETKDPEHIIPVSVVAALFIILISYCSVAAVVTLMCPYFLINVNTPLPFVFRYVGWDVARYIIAIGAMAGLSTSLLGSMFPLPRVLYAMGSDGLIFRFLAKVSPRFKTPLIGTIVSGLFAGTLAMVFSLKELIEMMSIGTLLAYTLVAICVLILRYETDDNMPKIVKGSKKRLASQPTEPLQFRYMLFPPNTDEPSHTTSAMTKTLVAAMCLTITAFDSVVSFCEKEIWNLEGWVLFIMFSLGFVALFFLFCITRQPVSKIKLSFYVPLVPYVPAFSCLVNVYLMFKLDTLTWIRFGVWMVLGMLMYFCYGIKNASMISWYEPHSDSEDEEEEKTDTKELPSHGYTALESGDKEKLAGASEVDHYHSISDHSP